MRVLISNSSVSANTATLDAGDEVVNTYVFSLVNEGSFAGTVKVAARIYGRGRAGATTFPHFLAITNRRTGSVVDGNTGVTEAGIYSVDLSGCEARIEVTRTAGAYSVYGKPVVG
jgi:hypothetical protein